MPFTAWKHKERNRHGDRKNVFTMTSGAFVIAVRNNFLPSNYIKDLSLAV